MSDGLRSEGKLRCYSVDRKFVTVQQCREQTFTLASTNTYYTSTENRKYHVEVHECETSPKMERLGGFPRFARATPDQ